MTDRRRDPRRTTVELVVYPPGDCGCGWRVMRPDWWTLGSKSGVTRNTAAQASAELDAWQDAQWRRSR